MALDLEAMGDKAGARRTRDRLQSDPETTAASEPASAPAPGPRRGDRIFLDTGEI